MKIRYVYFHEEMVELCVIVFGAYVHRMYIVLVHGTQFTMKHFEQKIWEEMVDNGAT